MGSGGVETITEKREQRMLALTPPLDERFTTFSNTALTGAILTDRERALAVLTTVLALEENDLIEQAVVCAKQAGITNEEIGQTSAIVLAVQGVFKRYCLQGSMLPKRLGGPCLESGTGALSGDAEREAGWPCPLEWTA